jgi:DNA transposition AAA+ family ATPase
MNNDVKTRVHRFIDDNEISLSALGRSIGYSSGSLISQWLNETQDKPFRGDRRKLETALTQYLSNYERKRSEKVLEPQEFIPTNDYKMARYVVEQAIKHGRMALLFGAPGTGKTTAIKKIISDMPEAILIEADVSMTAKTLFSTLCKRLGVEAPPRNLYEMEETVCDRLRRRDAVLIIDEGEHLPYRALEMLRRVWDFTQTPIIYAGTRILMDNITGGARNAEYAQLKRRIRGKWEFRGLVHEELDEEGRLTKNDVELKRVCGAYGANNEAAIKAVYRIAGGNFGNTVDLLEQSGELAALNETQINKEIVEEAASMLLI